MTTLPEIARAGPVLASEAIIGPAHQFKADLGAVKTKAVTEKVTKIGERKRA